MGMAITVQDWLRSKGHPYALLRHAPSHYSMESAELAHVPPDRLAKAVLLGDEWGYLLAVLPSSYRLELSEVEAHTRRHLQLVDESVLAKVFEDCEPGALPPLGMAYGLDTMVDERLAPGGEVFFEAGDHRSLVCMRSDAFLKMMADADVARFSHRF